MTAIRRRLFAMACGTVAVVYFAAFIWSFEILSSPVRDNKHGWLGPPIRGDVHTIDIGKAYYYEGTDFSAYRRFQPLCKAWLIVMGF